MKNKNQFVQAIKCCLTNGKFALLLFSSILLLNSCSSGLTRANAEKVIKTHVQLPYDEYKEIKLLMTTDTIFSASDKTQHGIQGKRGLLLNLEKEGLITYTIEQTYPYEINEAWWDGGLGYSPPKTEEQKQQYINSGYRQVIKILETYQHTGILTEKGKQFLMPNGTFKVASIDFGEITGIIEHKEFNIADVDYTLKRTNITPFGKACGLENETFNKKQIFKKYDDGWRIE